AGFDQLRLWDVTGGPFVRLTHVHDDERFAILQTLAKLTHGEHRHAFSGQAGPLPGGHAAIEISREIVVADADELAHGVLVDLRCVGNEDDGRTEWHNPADPRGERWAKLDVINARDMAVCVVVNRAHVD